MHLSAVYSFAAMLPFALAIPAFEKVFDATVTLDLNARSSVAVPGGTKLGIPVTEVTISGLFEATSSGYSWTTTYDAGSEAAYTDVEVLLHGQTSDGIPFNIIEAGSGKKSETTLRRIRFEIGAPYEYLRSEYLLAEVVTPAPNLTIATYKYIQ